MMQMVYSSLSKKKFVMLERSLFLFLSLVALQSIAQDYARKLDWQIKPRIISTIDGKQISQPTFTNAGHSEEKNMLAVYVERIPASVAGDVSVELVNAVYSPVTLPTGSDVYLSSKVEVRSAMAFQKKQPRVLVEMIPFRKNDAGQVEKLETFTLRVRITPQVAKAFGQCLCR
jgi:hypothetical protein